MRLLLTADVCVSYGIYRWPVLGSVTLGPVGVQGGVALGPVIGRVTLGAYGGDLELAGLMAKWIW